MTFRPKFRENFHLNSKIFHKLELKNENLDCKTTKICKNVDLNTQVLPWKTQNRNFAKKPKNNWLPVADVRLVRPVVGLNACDPRRGTSVSWVLSPSSSPSPGRPVGVVHNGYYQTPGVGALKYDKMWP